VDTADRQLPAKLHCGRTPLDERQRSSERERQRSPERERQRPREREPERQGTREDMVLGHGRL
jgi:hypothetical protein